METVQDADVSDNNLDEEEDEVVAENLNLPDHKFVQNAKNSGKVSLFIEDYIFRRRYIRKDIVKFTCTGCEKISRKNKLSKDASAIARLTDEGYILLETSSHEDHKCWSSVFNVMIKEAVAEMLARVEEDPTQKIPRIYNEVRSKYTEKLDLDSRCSFLQDFPTYRNIQSRLYNKKYEFVPRDPVDMKDFDPDLPWCRLISGENIIKGDTLLENGKRILMFSTNDLLEIAARAAEILGDGTFKITPKLWGQVFVISALSLLLTICHPKINCP